MPNDYLEKIQISKRVVDIFVKIEILLPNYLEVTEKKQYLCIQNKKTEDIEVIKRTREEVRAAFREYMREKREENEAAQIRLQEYHQKRLAGAI